MLKSECMLRVKICEGLGPCFQIQLLKTVHNLSWLVRAIPSCGPIELRDQLGFSMVGDKIMCTWIRGFRPSVIQFEILRVEIMRTVRILTRESQSHKILSRGSCRWLTRLALVRSPRLSSPPPYLLEESMGVFSGLRKWP